MPWYGWLIIALLAAAAIAAGIWATIYLTRSHGAALKVRFSPHKTSAARLIGGHVDRRDLVLTSLQYYLHNIQLASDLTMQGTGWSNPQNPLVLSSAADGGDYDTYGYTEAAADTEHYTDLLRATDRAKLNLDLPLTHFATATDVVFHYVMVNWMQPIKFTAVAHTYDGSAWQPALYTKTGSAHQQVCDDNNYCNWVTTTPSMTQTPAQEVIVRHNNGGSVVKLFTPIRYADLVATPHTLHLIFDPYQSLRARASTETGRTLQPNLAVQEVAEDTPTGRYFTIGLLTMTPVLVPEGSRIVRHQFRLVLPLVGWDLLLQLYTVNDELRAADLGALTQADTYDLPEDAPTFAYSIMSAVQAGAAGWTLAGYLTAQPFITGFVLNASGTCQLHTEIAQGQMPSATSTYDTVAVPWTRLTSAPLEL